MSKQLLILQSNYIPWKGYFDCIRTCDEFVVYDDMQYTKGDWRNRNRIKTPQGPQWLTIPVTIRGRLGQSIRDTRVANKDWPAIHWRKIQACYADAPYLAEYRDFFGDLYDRAGRLDFLTDVNLLFLTEICSLLEIETRFRSSSEFELAALVGHLRDGSPSIRTRNHQLDEGYILLDTRELTLEHVPVIAERIQAFVRG